LTDRKIAGGTVIVLDGDFDLAARGRVTDAFAAVADEPLVVLDLERTHYIDSTVLSCLMRLRSDISERGGTLVLTNPKPMIQRLLDIAGLTPLFDFLPGVAGVRERYGLEDGALRRIELLADSVE
jgi:anti-anti-sigma factor